MRLSRQSLQIVTFSLAALLSLPLGALAAGPSKTSGQQPAAASTGVDIVLTQGGVLRGYVVNGQGVAVPGTEVKLTAPNGQKVVTKADAKGRFGYQGLAGGQYTLETELGSVACRAWTAKAAPPRTATSLLMVHDAQIARGQWAAPPAANGFVSNMKNVMTHPFAVAGIIGAAVAIPVAIHNSNDDDSHS